MTPPYAGIYGNMKFPEYKFQEYPKMLLGHDGKPLQDEHGKCVIVNSIHEELRAQDSHRVAPSAAREASEVESLKMELEALRAELEVARTVAKVEPPAEPEAKRPLTLKVPEKTPG